LIDCYLCCIRDFDGLFLFLIISVSKTSNVVLSFISYSVCIQDEGRTDRSEGLEKILKDSDSFFECMNLVENFSECSFKNIDWEPFWNSSVVK
jgi:hypothetical protein